MNLPVQIGAALTYDCTEKQRAFLLSVLDYFYETGSISRKQELCVNRTIAKIDYYHRLKSEGSA